MLLKTRAGENVLALLSAVVSVLEDDAAEVFSLLLDKLNTPSHSIPSISQLENLRSLCLPLSRKLDFKDRLAEMYQLLLSEFEVSTMPFFRADDVLPDTDTMAKLVKRLKDVFMQRDQQTLKLYFYGTRGAAWLAVYASKVLGLAVCFVRKDGSLYPLEGTYSSAHVLLFPENSEQPSELFKHVGHPSDVIVLSSKDKSISVNWLISCDEGGVDVFGSYCGWRMKDRQEVGDLIFSIAREYVETRVCSARLRTKQGTYFERDLEGPLRSLQEILHLFGLPQQPRGKTDWRTGNFQRITRAGKESVEIKLKLLSTMLAHVEEDKYDFCSHAKLQPSEMNQLPALCVRCRLYGVVRYTAYVSSCLAFTDWDRSFRKISIKSLPIGQDSLSQKAFSYFEDIYDIDPIERAPADTFIDGPSLSRGDLATEICQICCGSQYGLDLVYSNSKSFLGVNIDGMLLVDYRALEPSLQPGPIFIIREGEFCLGEERRPLLTAPSHGGSSVSDPDMHLESLRPWNHFEGASLSVTASLLKTAILLRYTFIFEESGDSRNPFRSLEFDVPVASILPALQQLYVAKSCVHPLGEALEVSKVIHGSTSYLMDESGTFWRIQNLRNIAQEGGETPVPHFSLCPVLNNSISQWAFLALLENRSHGNRFEGLLLQQKTCLNCVRDQALGISEELGETMNVLCAGLS